MGTRHSREEILEGALATALDGGLSQLSFGRVGQRLGIADRTVVYYFPTKDELISAVLGALGLSLQQALAASFSDKAPDHKVLVQAAWPVLARPAADPLFALFFEANGLAAAGREPYRTLVPALVTAWIEWAADYVEGPPAKRRREAESAIALLDGLLLLRQLAGPKAAQRAAGVLGVR